MARKVKRGRSLSFFRVTPHELAVLSVSQEIRLPASLTAAERAVVVMVFAGKSNVQIARARGVAMRTVANQVASVLKKVGVGSRAALIAKLGRK